MVAREKKSKRKFKFRDVRHALSAMGKEAVQATSLAARSLTERTDKHEQQLKEVELRLDEMEDELETIVLQFLDSRRPKGKKLRFCTVAMKIASDYERVGDRSLEMVKRLRRIESIDNVRIPPSLLQMSDKMKSMVEFAIESIDNRDLALAEKVIHDHQQLIDVHRSVFDDLNNNGLHENPAAIQLTLIARHLDRIGDVARTIAENVEFVIIGDSSDAEGP